MPWAQVGHTGEDKHARDVPFLDSYADKQWEVIIQKWLVGYGYNVIFINAQQGILSYMVEGACEDITRDTVDILQEANLMARYGQTMTN